MRQSGWAMVFVGAFWVFGVMMTMTDMAKADDVYKKDTETFRRRRETDLLAEDGWLSLAGLHWLKAGTSVVGSGLGCAVRLPASVAERVGVLEVDGDRVRFRAEAKSEIFRDGKRFLEGELRTDLGGKQKPDVLALGTVRMMVIQRGDRLAVRVKDLNSPARLRFRGLKWFPIDESWRITGRFQPATEGMKPLTVDTVVGTKETLECPGFVVFERDGREYRLAAAREGDRLWFVFRDATAGRTTSYNARQLTADPPENGEVILDFNRAVNLPCAYTPFATCPMAPKENRLGLEIPAGEKMYEPDNRENPPDAGKKKS